MVKVTSMGGPFAGRVRHFEGGKNIETGEEFDPVDLFSSFVRHGWQWEADYARATDEEILLWFRAEIAARIMRALAQGRPVQFLDKVWRAEGEVSLDLVQEIEDTVADSGRLITLDSDDEKGLVIGVRGWEH